jgi:outer membrane immunogenic protein
MRRQWRLGVSLPAIILAATGANIATTGASLAADAVPAFKAPLAAKKPKRLYDWSGFYIGGHAGIGAIDSDGFFATSVDLSFGGNAFLAGAQIGWNFQHGNLVFGIEGDYSTFKWEDVNLREEHYLAQANQLVTVRGRVGWADDNVLFYATGGLAHLRAHVATSLGGIDPDQQGNEDRKNVSSFGGVAGVGLEWGVAGNLSVRAEALYLFFDKYNSLADLKEGCAPGREGCLDTKENFFSYDDGFVFRLGVNWRPWSWSSGDVAGYAASPAAFYKAAPATRYPGWFAAPYDWSGVHFGVHVGYGGVKTGGIYANDRINPLTDNPAGINLGSFDNFGLVGGAQIGFNWQFGSTVVGVTADISATDWDDLFVDLQIPEQPAQTLALDLDYLAMLRGRVGWAFGNKLVYVTAGAVFVGGEFRVITVPAKKDISAIGGVVGGGLEWGIAPDFSLWAEGLYLAFDEKTDLADLKGLGVAGDHVDIGNGYLFRVGANWRPWQAAYAGFAANYGHPAGPVGPYNWTGFYIGAHGGWGGLTTEGTYNLNPTPSEVIDLTGVNDLGVLGGGQAGWNWQVSSIVLGIEGDVAATRWNGSQAEFANPSQFMEFDSHLLATLRGRVGWAENGFLLYATGGLAVLNAKLDNTSNDGGQTKDVNALGAAIGVGMEWGVTQNLSIKVEGLFLAFDKDYSIQDIGSEGDQGDFFRIDDGFIARVGVNWRPYRFY